MNGAGGSRGWGDEGWEKLRVSLLVIIEFHHSLNINPPAPICPTPHQKPRQIRTASLGRGRPPQDQTPFACPTSPSAGARTPRAHERPVLRSEPTPSARLCWNIAAPGTYRRRDINNWTVIIMLQFQFIAWSIYRVISCSQDTL